MKKNILIVDDDVNMSLSVKDLLATDEIDVFLAPTGRESITILKSIKVDLVILDQKLPDMEGPDLCPEIFKYNEDTRIIFITAFPSFKNALQAIKYGVHDYISKPFDPDQLKLSIIRQFDLGKLEKVKRVQVKKIRDEKKKNILIGNFGEGSNINRLIEVGAFSDKPVLITGETGTGKSVVARAIHLRGNRSGSPYFNLNCAAIPETLIEAELFGNEKGAFTGAVSKRRGVFEISDGGTLLLDEIGAMPLHLQPKILGFLDDGIIKRLGGEVTIRLNTRIIAATNSNLDEMIKDGRFRQDLYYRLGVILITIPPLRKRPEDIPDLVKHFVEVANPGKNLYVPDDEIKKLMQYKWPGNIRELRNIIERSTLMFKEKLLPSKLLFGDNGIIPERDEDIKSKENQNIKSLSDVETDHIRFVLKKNMGNLTRSSRVLGISLSTLKRKVKQIKVD